LKKRHFMIRPPKVYPKIDIQKSLDKRPGLRFEVPPVELSKVQWLEMFMQTADYQLKKKIANYLC